MEGREAVPTRRRDPQPQVTPELIRELSGFLRPSDPTSEAGKVFLARPGYQTFSSMVGPIAEKVRGMNTQPPGMRSRHREHFWEDPNDPS